MIVISQAFACLMLALIAGLHLRISNKLLAKIFWGICALIALLGAVL